MNKSEWVKLDRKKNPEKYRQRVREYKARHREELNRKRSEYYYEHHEQELQRKREYDDAHRKPKPTLEQYFWNKVTKASPDECWLWTGKPNADGYGTGGYDGKHFKAHKKAYELTHGPIPDGMCVCHTCDNRICCNPNHLWLGTHQDNYADMIAKGRNAIGAKNGSTKLTISDVQLIKSLLAQRVSYPVIAKQFGVGCTCIANIANGKTWKHAITTAVPDVDV